MTPEGWKCVTLSEVATVNPEQIGPNTTQDYEIEYIDIASIERTGVISSTKKLLLSEAPSRARRRVKSNDIVASTVRPYLRAFARVKYAAQNLVASTGFAVIRPVNSQDSEFLYQHVLSAQFIDFLTPRMRGGNYPAVGGDDVSSYPLLLPPIWERRKIAAILSSMDEAIEATQAVIDQLQVVKKAMMAELLTRGLPGRHTRFKMTEIGEVPEGWEVVRLGSVLASGPDNGLYKPQSEYGSGMPIVRIDAYDNGDVVSEAGLRRVRVAPLEAARFSLQPGDLLVNRVNSLSHIAKAALVGELQEPILFESNMMRFRLSTDQLLPAFGLRIISSSKAKEHFVSRAKLAVAQASVNQQDIRALPIPLPSHEEQLAIVEVFAQLDNRIAIERAFFKVLTEARSSLLGVLLTGEVRVNPSGGETKNDPPPAKQPQSEGLGLPAGP